MALEFRLCGPTDIAPMQDRILRWKGRSGDTRLPVAVGIGLLIGHPELGECWLLQRQGTPIGYAAVEFGPGPRDARIACVFVVEGLRGLGLAATARRFVGDALRSRRFAATNTPGGAEDAHWELPFPAGATMHRPAA